MSRINMGMPWDDALSAFLISRQRGVDGARGPARAKTLLNYREDLGLFIFYMEGLGLTHYNQVKRQHVLAYLDRVQNDTIWSKSTKNKRLRALRTFFSWVDKSEECRMEEMKSWGRLLPKIPRNTPRLMTLDKNDIRKFLKSMNTKTRSGLRDYVICSLLLDCGLRIGEVRLLALSDIHLETARGSFLCVPEDGKTGARIVFVSEPLTRLLKLWLRKRSLFTKPETTNVFVGIDGKPLKETALDHSFRRRALKLGLTGISPHMFRHFFCTDFLRNGGNVAELQALTGHKQLSTLEGYLHLAGDRKVAEAQSRCSPLKNLNCKET